MKRLWQIIGYVVVAIGIGAAVEAGRIQNYQAAFGFGPTTFPLVLGVSLILVGAYLAITGGSESTSTELIWPRGRQGAALLGVLATLIVYSAAISLLGYFSATILASVALFRIFGRYSWGRSVIGAAACGGVLYVVFVYLAGIPLPHGVIG